MSPLLFLRATCDANHGLSIDGDDRSGVFKVTPPLASGAPPTEYLLVIKAAGSKVTVAEASQCHLPSACPDRHINPDGTFCLFWEEVEDAAIQNNEAANLWWGKLLLFLRRQASASKLRMWPGKGDARAHGDAARYQASAEAEAEKLGPSFRTALREERLSTVKRTKSGKKGRSALLLDGKRLLTVLVNERRVMTLRQRCKCDWASERKLPMSDCQDHAAVFVNFTLAMQAWRSAELEYEKALKRQKFVCCGTLDECPFASSETETAKLAA
ncbi:E2 domain-associated cysteine-rich protein [Rhizobium ruizarguesonis]